jgi:hypothetical protein
LSGAASLLNTLWVYSGFGGFVVLKIPTYIF